MPTPSLHPTVNPFSFSANPSPSFCKPFSSPPLSDPHPQHRTLQRRFTRFVKVKVVILNSLLIRPLYWSGQGAMAWSISVASQAPGYCVIYSSSTLLEPGFVCRPCLMSFIGVLCLDGTMHNTRLKDKQRERERGRSREDSSTF